MVRAGISKLDVKRRNRTQILNILREKGPTSRVDIAESLDITRAAVTIITNEMIDDGIVFESGENSGEQKKLSRGRKKRPIDICENYKFGLGICIDEGVVTAGLSNLRGATLDKKRIVLEKNDKREDVIKKIGELVTQLKYDSCLDDNKIIGVGCCISMSEHKRMKVPVQNEFSDFTELEQKLAKKFKMPVVIGRTISALALTELEFSSPAKNIIEGPNGMLYVRCGWNIDAAIIINTETGYATKPVRFDHLKVDMDGEECSCGRKGCGATQYSLATIENRIKEIYSIENTPRLYEITGGDKDKALIETFKASSEMLDENVRDAFYKALDYFSMDIANFVTIINSETIVIATDFGDLDNSVFEYVTEKTSEYVKFDVKDRFVLSPLKKSTLYRTGCAMAVREFFIKTGG